ncbi:TfoX/Sxy family protein [Kiloniella majae]|uniref:TfoX/Sxy family protein n=1 Tax=Kiloniella majae TaxID=1938558 RepID=UPI000A27738D|nr:TfoX/Sxy family protein [Kiloniella majae]
MLEDPDVLKANFSLYILEQLEPLGALKIGRFFGGKSIKYQNKQFCMIMKNRLYFRVGPNNLAEYLVYGAEPFSYLTKNGRVQVKKYYEVPADVLDDVDELRSWAKRAIEAALK